MDPTVSSVHEKAVLVEMLSCTLGVVAMALLSVPCRATVPGVLFLCPVNPIAINFNTSQLHEHGSLDSKVTTGRRTTQESSLQWVWSRWIMKVYDFSPRFHDSASHACLRQVTLKLLGSRALPQQDAPVWQWLAGQVTQLLAKGRCLQVLSTASRSQGLHTELHLWLFFIFLF